MCGRARGDGSVSRPFAALLWGAGHPPTASEEWSRSGQGTLREPEGPAQEDEGTGSTTDAVTNAGNAAFLGSAEIPSVP